MVKTLGNAVLYPLTVIFSYFVTSYVYGTLISGAGNEKLFANSLPMIVVGIMIHIVLFSGIVYCLYLFVRGSKPRRILALVSIVLSVTYHVFTV